MRDSRRANRYPTVCDAFSVDFAAFPSMLVQLLEKCRVEGEVVGGGGGESPPRFILVLNCAAAGGHQASLEFTELNMFKHLCHLSLIVVKASDMQLKVG